MSSSLQNLQRVPRRICLHMKHPQVFSTKSTRPPVSTLPTVPTLTRMLRSSCRTFATGTRGSRGHGWYQNYRAGKGGRHLQGEYHNRESLAECAAWNDAVLQLGSTRVYMDIVAEPRRQTSTVQSKKMIEVPSLDTLQGETYRLEIELASMVMKETSQNFIDLLSMQTVSDDGYLGTRLYRIEKNVGLCGGDVLTNTGKTGKAANGDPLTMDVTDPLPLWHIPGTITMLVPKVGEIDSRFMLCTQHAPHIDGICRAFGRLTEASVAVVHNWQMNLLTRDGIPTAYDLIVVKCGLLQQQQQRQHHHHDHVTSKNGTDDVATVTVAQGS